MSPIFNEIRYIPSAEPLDGALQMALDELLLKEASGVILRDYTWSSPTVTIGYFGNQAELEADGEFALARISHTFRGTCPPEPRRRGSRQQTAKDTRRAPIPAVGGIDRPSAAGIKRNAVAVEVCKDSPKRDEKCGLGKPLIRRPTGGGLVEHGHGLDFTYSVVIGAAITRERQLSPRASYRTIHGVLSQVLREFGFPATLAEPGLPGGGGAACFANPVGDDLLLNGTKVAGAGQKRSRGAILHQGSVQPLILPPEFAHAFARALAGRVDTVPLNPELLAQAEELANEKYRRSSWNRRR